MHSATFESFVILKSFKSRVLMKTLEIKALIDLESDLL